MSDHWDFYLLTVDDKPASIFLDLGLHEEAPNPRLPNRAYIRIEMLLSRPDGMSSSEEYDSLVKLETTLEKALNNAKTLYVGRCTTDGCRDLYFYIAKPADWQERVNAVMADFPGYRFQTGVKEDPEWSAYFEFLYPSDRDLQRISNRSVCDALKRNGDPLEEPRDIDHWCYFPTAADREAFLAEVLPLGYQLRELDQTDGERPFKAQVFRSDIPDLDGIEVATMPLYEAALRHHGDYDGWECEVRASTNASDKNN
jgi:hypothetical protein